MEEMTIQKSESEVAFLLVIYLTVVIFMVLAIVNIFLRVALIPSCIWIALVNMIIWSKSRKQGGLLRFLANCLGDIFGRHFAEIPTRDLQWPEIRFGYELFGHRFFNQTIRIDRIEMVAWRTGQATDMAGQDMNDWHVFLWYDHCEQAKSEKRQKLYRKPDQDLYIVGPSTKKNKTEALGMELVAFLQSVGATLVQSEMNNCFVRTDAN